MDANTNKHIKNTTTFSIWAMCILLTGCISLSVQEMSDATGPTPTIAAMFQKQTPVPVETSGDIIDAFISAVWGDEHASMPDSEALEQASSANNFAVGGADAAVQRSPSEAEIASPDIEVPRSHADPSGRVFDLAQSTTVPRKVPTHNVLSSDAERQGLTAGDIHTSDGSRTVTMAAQATKLARTPVVLQSDELQRPDHNNLASLNDTLRTTDSHQEDILADAMRDTQVVPILTGTPISRYTARLNEPRLVIYETTIHTPAPVRLPTPLLDEQLLTQRPRPSATPKSTSTPISYADLMLWSFILP